MELGSQKTVEKTVRKLKTAQANRGGSSLGIQEAEAGTKKKTTKRKIPRANNIFKRI